MPLQKLQFRPGINREGTDYSNEGGYFDCDKIRFRSGFPEKIGGWSRMANAQFLGLARSLWNWLAISGSNYLGVGTNIKYYIEQGGEYYDITPVTFTSANVANAFTITSGSNAMVVVDGSYSPSVGDYLTISNAANISTSNVTATVLNAEYSVISIINTTAYTVTLPVTANASATGGGSATDIAYQQPIGLNTYTIGTGWGAGPWPVTGITTSLTNPFATTNGSNSVVVTQTAHGLSNGKAVIFANAVATGGVSAVLLNTLFYPTVANANAYTITVQANATSNVAAGGGNVIAYTETGTHGWGTGFTSGIGQQLRLWTNDNYGQQLFIAPRGGGVFYWIPAGQQYPDTTQGGLETRAQSLATQSTAAGFDGTRVPTETNQIVASAIQRFVICMGANPYDPSTANTDFDPLLVRWSDQENPYEWVPAVTNQSGEFRLSSGSFIMCARNTRQEILVWTDAAIYSMQYLGPPYVWGFQVLQDNISIMSPNAAITVNNVTYWMGVDKFYTYSGRVETLPCSLWQYIFNDINKEQAFQVFCGSNEGYSEIWWFYCSQGSNNIDKYVIYNYLERTWYYGTMARTAWLDSGIREYPMAADYNSRMLFHESAVDDVAGIEPVPIVSYVQSSDFDIGDGHNFGFVWRILPDINFTGSNVNQPSVTMTVKPRQNSGAPYGAANNPGVISSDNYSSVSVYNIQEFTGQVYTRLRGRQLAFRIESTTLGVAWQLGSPRIDIRNDGRR
jgi:hypothetical protein